MSLKQLHSETTISQHCFPSENDHLTKLLGWSHLLVEWKGKFWKEKKTNLRKFDI